MIERTKLHYRNAKTVIAQMKRGEWVAEVRTNGVELYCRVLVRNGQELWVNSGALFLDFLVPLSPNAFGLLFRHWVWWAGARRIKLDADLSLKPSPFIVKD